MDRRDFIKYGTVLAGVGGACLLCKNCGVIFKKNTADIKSSKMDTRPCLKPFENSEIHKDGNVYPCCPDFLKYKTSAGNIEKEDFEKIWNGEIYTDLRQRVLKGDYSMCKRDVCCMYTPCSGNEIPSDYKKSPREIKISYDLECNYNCITCRDSVIINTPEEMSLYDEVYLPKIIEMAKNANTLITSLSGDALFSRHSRHLITELVKKYPNIKFDLFTNGFLLDEKTITELGIQYNIYAVSVSVNAVNRETYKKILRTDAFDRVMKNLELMSEWKKRGKIEWMTINFVVHLLNYKEMPDFVKLAQKLNATAFFSTYRPWTSSALHKKYDEFAVFEPKNPHYKELAEILHDPIFKDTKHCQLEPRLLDIANS